MTSVSNWSWLQIGLIWMTAAVIWLVLFVIHLYVAPSFALPVRESGRSKLFILRSVVRGMWRISPALVVESILIPLIAIVITFYWIIERVHQQLVHLASPIKMEEDLASALGEAGRDSSLRRARNALKVLSGGALRCRVVQVQHFPKAWRLVTDLFGPALLSNHYQAGLERMVAQLT